MFAPCPHCGYLIALIATGDAAPRECPRCHRLMDAPVAPPVQRAQAAPRAPAPLDPQQPTASASIATPPTAAVQSATAANVQRAPVAVASPAKDTPKLQSMPPVPDRDTTPASSDSVSSPPSPDVQHATPPIARAAAVPVPPGAHAATTPRSPSFAHRRGHAPPTRHVWAWRLGATALALVLALQLLLSQRELLAHDAQWRPVLARVCAAGLCTLPPARDAAAFDMVERQVRPTAGTGTLAVQARFRNGSPWPQAWPHLQLVLSDAQGLPAAARVFSPAEYAGAAAGRPIAPGQTVDARLRVTEPQPATVAFAFDFR